MKISCMDIAHGAYFQEPEAPRFPFLSLSGELLTKVMEFTVASDEPVDFLLFLQWTLSPEHQETESGKQPWSFGYGMQCMSLPGDQVEHYVDWIGVTETCRRMRDFGKPAFFRRKRFIIPPSMVRDLHEGKIQYTSFNIAQTHIQHVEVPVNEFYPFMLATDFILLPIYHYFASLKSLTIRVRNERDNPEMELRSDTWPYAAPKKLLDLLGQLGLRVGHLRVSIIVDAPEESRVPLIVDRMVKRVHSYLKLRLEQNTKA